MSKEMENHKKNVNKIKTDTTKTGTISSMQNINRWRSNLNTEYICYYPKHMLQTYLRTAILKALQFAIGFMAMLFQSS